jgi:hypothetical protein
MGAALALNRILDLQEAAPETCRTLRQGAMDTAKFYSREEQAQRILHLWQLAAANSLFCS